VNRTFLALLHFPVLLVACLFPFNFARALSARHSTGSTQIPFLPKKSRRRKRSASAATLGANQQPAPSASIASHKQHRWGANTSGPFFTGTAEVEPPGSFYWEPYIFDNRNTSSASHQFTQKMAIGMGHHLELDTLIPLTLNTIDASASPTGKSIKEFGPGDAQLSFKYELTTDADTYHFLARPAITLTANFVLPTGNYTYLNPQLNGADQFGNGTWQQGIGMLIRKRFKPFVLYGQLGEFILDPTTVSHGYGFDNVTSTVTSNSPTRMVDGNLFTYSGALEDVFNSKHGIGGLIEFAGETQASSGVFGSATAPSFSYLTASPELEFTWPAGNRFAITWGGGVAIPIQRRNYPRIVTPMMTLTFYFNGPHGGRSSH
jgi:hypothetical protein